MKEDYKKKIDWVYLRRKPLLWLYSAFLTLRYVDKWDIFPAFKFNGFFKVIFHKSNNSFLGVSSQLIFEKWLNGNEITTIQLGVNSHFQTLNDFLIGNGVKISLSDNAKLLVKGKKNETASGITANSIILVNNYLEIGYDCLIAWDTFLTDSDWHQIGNQINTLPTVIQDHVWIGMGAKILKGVKIGSNCIIASQSTVLQGFYTEQSLIVGTPAKIIKSNVEDWKREMQY